MIPTSAPSRIRAIPKGSSCSRQRPIISRYRGSNTCNGRVVSGNRTVWRGKSGRRTGCGHPAGGHKPAHFGRMSSPTTHAVRHPGQLTSRRIASPSSAILNVKKSGLLHRGQLKFKPPTVMPLLEGPSGLKVALASRQVYESLVLPRSFMRVEKVVSPPLDNNAYFLFDEVSRLAAVVDPALAGEELLAMSEKFGEDHLHSEHAWASGFDRRRRIDPDRDGSEDRDFRGRCPAAGKERARDAMVPSRTAGPHESGRPPEGGLRSEARRPCHHRPPHAGAHGGQCVFPCRDGGCALHGRHSVRGVLRSYGRPGRESGENGLHPPAVERTAGRHPRVPGPWARDDDRR